MRNSPGARNVGSVFPVGQVALYSKVTNQLTVGVRVSSSLFFSFLLLPREDENFLRENLHQLSKLILTFLTGRTWEK